MNVFALRAAELTEDRPELAGAVEPLLKAREAIERQIADLDGKVLRLARVRCSREQNALHTLIRQRHLTPSCGGQVPTRAVQKNPQY
jgi:hypothetical protein